MADIIIAALGLVFIVILWVAIYDSNRFTVKNFTVRDPRIRKNCRAVVLADLHNKCYGKNNERLLAAIRSQKPDFILVAGDLPVARPGASLEPALRLVGELARDYPIYYGNGNHEYRMKLYPKTYGDMAEKYGQALHEMGVDPLVNSHAALEEYGLCVYGAEIQKKYYKRFMAAKMDGEYMTGLLGRPAKDRYTVLLAHNPDYFPQYAAWGADLVLSGHVHGGVARVPFWGRGVISPGLRLFPKYDGGVFHEADSVMILSRGLGMHTIPVRVFNPAELWVVDFEEGGPG